MDYSAQQQMKKLKLKAKLIFFPHMIVQRILRRHFGGKREKFIFKADLATHFKKEKQHNTPSDHAF